MNTVIQLLQTVCRPPTTQLKLTYTVTEFESLKFLKKRTGYTPEEDLVSTPALLFYKEPNNANV